MDAQLQGGFGLVGLVEKLDGTGEVLVERVCEMDGLPGPSKNA